MKSGIRRQQKAVLEYRKISACFTTHIELMDCVNDVAAWHDFVTQFVENED